MALPSPACGGSLGGRESAGAEQRSPPGRSARPAAGAGAAARSQRGRPAAFVPRPPRGALPAPRVSSPARRLVRRRRIHSCSCRWEGEGGCSPTRAAASGRAGVPTVAYRSHRHRGGARLSSGSIRRVPPDPPGWLFPRQAVPRAGGPVAARRVHLSPGPCPVRVPGAFAAGRTGHP